MSTLLLLLGLAQAGVVPAAPSAGAKAAFAPRRVAVVIGVQEYTDPVLRGLRWAEKDATDLGAALQDPTAGGFDRVFVIHGAAATTRASLLNAIRVATADLGRDDTFVLYLSGHGTLTLDPLEGSRLWFLPSDARLDEPERTGLEVQVLEDLVNGLAARRRVLILDTCHNGRAGSKSSLGEATTQLVNGLRGEVPAPRPDREVAESEARLFAAQYYQPAMEDPELQNGVYTHFLVEALRGGRTAADLDHDGLVDVAEAHEYARDKTIAYTGGLQIPRAEYRVVGREDIFLSGPASTRTAAERALVAAYDLVLNRAKLIVNGTPRGELPGLYAVDPGPQTIEITTEDGRTLLKERVHAAPGETIGVEALLERRRGYAEVLAGPAFVGGLTDAEGGVGLHPVASSLAVGWVRPWSATPARWRPDLQLGASFATGELGEGTPRPLATGEVWAGGTWAVDLGAVYVGPTASLHLPYRTELTTGWREAGLAPAGGLALGLELPVGRHAALDVRADAWAGEAPWGGAWTPWWGGGVRVGMGVLP